MFARVLAMEKSTFLSVIFSLFWMGLLSCLTHPSPVIRGQALTGRVTKGCNLPSAKCDSGTGRVRNTCEKPSSRSAAVSERWWNVSLGECEGQHPCQDWGGEKWRLEWDLPSRCSFWTPPLLVRCYKSLSLLWIFLTHHKKKSSGPSCWAEPVCFLKATNIIQARSVPAKKKRWLRPSLSEMVTKKREEKCGVR